MRTLQEIKDEVAAELGKKNWSNLLHLYGSVTDEVWELIAKRFAIEVATETMSNIAKNAKVTDGTDSAEQFVVFGGGGDDVFYVDQKTIIDINNIPKI